MIEDEVQNEGTFCQRFGHNWCKNSIVGLFTCKDCRKNGYCRGCAKNIPSGAETVICDKCRRSRRQVQR